MFELAFSDEDYRRQVTTFWDYSYPRDARLSPTTNTLWLVVSGGLGGDGLLAALFDRARLYEYDLRTRTIVHEFDLKPKDLPAACSAATPSATQTSMPGAVVSAAFTVTPDVPKPLSHQYERRPTHALRRTAKKNQPLL